MAKPLAALKEVFKNLFSKSSTQGYPFHKAGVDKNFRARIKYLPDLCVGCQLCVRNCPAYAITITLLNPQDKPAPGPDGKMAPPLRKFECKIDLTRCIFCAQCVDSCFKKALISTQDFELAALKKDKLTDTTRGQQAEDALKPSGAQCSVINSCDNDGRNPLTAQDQK